MPSQETMKTLSQHSSGVAQVSAQIERPINRGDPTTESDVASSAPQTRLGDFQPEFLEALWQTRLELAIFKLERRALPILNVFNRLPSNVRWHRDEGAELMRDEHMQSRTAAPAETLPLHHLQG
ncbi:hypothetical protein HYDPIDRAFT_27098 [Hydnomerulius pinastri MD-312]|nr:hypothetical protein HYDPIDRAFT_27098 [Hydnomerulius pinastri MD-312]